MEDQGISLQFHLIEAGIFDADLRMMGAIVHHQIVFVIAFRSDHVHQIDPGDHILLHDPIEMFHAKDPISAMRQIEVEIM